MKILISGGAGFIGRHLAIHLSHRSDCSIVVLDNLYRGSIPDLSQTDFSPAFVHGDIRDRGILSETMAGVDIVFHLAAQSNVIGANLDRDYSFSTNVAGTFNVLSAAEQAGVQKVIFASSREVYGEQQHFPVPEHAELKPKNAYGASKVAGEGYCRFFRSAGLPVQILRLANVYGPGDRDRVIPIFIENALRGEPLVLYGGDQVLDFVWIGTVLEAFERAMSLDALLESPVNIGSGTGVPIRELAQMVIQQTGSKSAITEVPGRPCETRGFIADIQRATELGLVDRPDSRLNHLDSMIHYSRVRLNDASRVVANAR
jgi:UDP-glucose 4-epimerase